MDGNPLKVYVNGELAIDCPERTIVIPAYHRADPKKCAPLPENTGTYRLRVEVGEAESFEELYYMVVAPDFYWAYRLDSVFSVEL